MRFENWDVQLNAYIDQCRTKKFSYGDLDCCLYPAGAILAMTGKDPLAEIRGTYSDEAGAIAAVRSLGETLEFAMEAIAFRNDWADVGPRHAQRGDLVLISDTSFGIETPFGGFAGICQGPVSSHFLLPRAGLVFTPLMMIARAWHVE